uniref:(northern house mosquito) hypothetical protein n=1 Tax=Culex pipiens TaxID=7175 RepID=A0A8D8GFK6_CULPI
MFDPPMAFTQSLFASQIYFSKHLSCELLYVLAYVFNTVIPATVASLIESFLPMSLAVKDRWEKDVFKASNKFTTIFMNCIGEPPLSTLSIPSLAPPPRRAVMIFNPTDITLAHGD